MGGETMADRIAAEVFPPGDFILEELESRGWTQIDLSEILGRPPQLVNEIVLGKRSITPETAKGLADAFGTSAQFWMNLQAAYQLSKTQNADEAVSRRAKVYAKAPIKEMVRRGWLEPSENVAVVEKRILDFFQIKSLDEEPTLWPHAARKSTSYDSINQFQLSWLCRARHLAKAVEAETFTDKSFNRGLQNLRKLLLEPEDVRLLPRVLAESGIRFLVIEHLPHTRIDGVCFWLNETAPVIAVSLRYDRIDWFWHTVMHELGHVKNRDGLRQNGRIDIDLVGDKAQQFKDKPESEKHIDEFASDFLIPQTELDGFVARVRPLYSTSRITGFAKRLGIHPGIVVGQLQHREEIKYFANRALLVKIRNIVIGSTLTDGWGSVVPAF
jgi:HTH-type transcriptional regulator/antitoxin HigA